MIPKGLHTVVDVLVAWVHRTHCVDDSLSTYLTLLPVRKTDTIVNHLLNLTTILVELYPLTLGIIVKSFDIHIFQLTINN